MDRAVSAGEAHLTLPEDARVEPSEGPSLRARRLAFRALTRLLRERLTRTSTARVGRLFALGLGVVAAFAAFALRAVDGPAASVEGLVLAAARAAAWLGAGGVALVAADQRAVRDRRDGIEILAMARGATPRGLVAARLVATMSAAFRAVVWPSLVAGAAAVVVSGSAHAALERAGLVVLTVVFAGVTGVTLGALSTISDRLRPTGGRGLFLGLVLLPWAAFDLVGRGVLSVPGALGALLRVGLDLIGLGRLA
jgi:hypothetical protein